MSMYSMSLNIHPEIPIYDYTIVSVGYLIIIHRRNYDYTILRGASGIPVIVLNTKQCF